MHRRRALSLLSLAAGGAGRDRQVIMGLVDRKGPQGRIALCLVHRNGDRRNLVKGSFSNFYLSILSLAL